MPRGVPKAGYRRRKEKRTNLTPKKNKNNIYEVGPRLVVSNIFETDEQIATRIAERFKVLQVLTAATIDGKSRSLIVSGPAGLGKSFTVEDCLKSWDPNALNHIIVKGYVKPTGLYKLLYDYREKGQVIVFDDADSVFEDIIGLNLIKAVCDTNETRRVSYLSEGNLYSEKSAEKIPSSFEFHGSVIFITNIDFDHLIDKGHKIAPHLQALISRSHYIDLSMKSKRDYLVRINQVIEEGLLASYSLFPDEKKDVVDFINKNSENLRELSLRTAMKLAALRRASGKEWEAFARVTNCRN